MNYLLKVYKRNFEKKEKLFSIFFGLFFLCCQYSHSQIKIPVNSNSLLNLNKGLQAFGFRTQDQWTENWENDFQSFFPDNIIPETTRPVEYLFYPYWQGRHYDKYQFWNIRRIGYFAYIINPENGTPVLTYSWTVRNFVEDAKPEGTKVDLVLYCNGKDDTDRFLDSETARYNCISLASLLVDKRDSLFSTDKTKLLNADGINIFLPDFSFKKKRKYGLLIKDLYWKYRYNDNSKKIIVTLPVRDTIQFDFFLGMKKYIDDLHFANYDYRGVNQNAGITEKWNKVYKSADSKLGFFAQIVAEIRLAEFVNPLKKGINIPEDQNNWEYYFLAICAILVIIAVSLVLSIFWCKFNQLIFDHLVISILLLVLLIIEIIFLFFFMVEEINFDVWLINTNNPNSNFFLLLPIVMLILFPLIKILQNRKYLP